MIQNQLNAYKARYDGKSLQIEKSNATSFGRTSNELVVIVVAAAAAAAAV